MRKVMPHNLQMVFYFMFLHCKHHTRSSGNERVKFRTATILAQLFAGDFQLSLFALETPQGEQRQ